MIIDNDLKRALLHEAGHAVAYYSLRHQSAGIAALREDMIFCNIVASDSPPIGVAAGSAAEVLILGNYDGSGSRADQKNLSASDAEYAELVTSAVSLISPYKRQMRRIQSRLQDSIRWRETLDDFPLIDWASIGLRPPQDGHTYSLIMPFEEIAEAMSQR